MVHLFKTKARQGKKAWPEMAAVALASALLMSISAIGSANAETRTLKLHFVHTGEKAEITYKKNGKYIDSGLKQANRILRDFRRNEPTKMDPKLLDLVWEVYQQSGSKGYVNVISGYRSPATNGMLRSRGRGVAKNSQHTLGKAMDFFITDVKLSKLREVGLKMGVGGVGFYPTSGSPFVHLDTGNVRHWPKMSRQELARIFPDGKTLHVPSDGKPMPKYEQALAEYKSKGRTSSVTVAAASETKKRGFFEMLAAKTQEDQADDEAGNAPETAVAPEPVVASASPAAAAPETLSAGLDAPAPPQAITSGAPVPATEVGAVKSEPKSVPLPEAAPRDLLTKPEEQVEVAALEEEIREGEIPLSRIPVPGRRPELVVAAVPETKPEAPITSVAALTADEIENIRRTAVPAQTQVAATTTQPTVKVPAKPTELALLEDGNQPQAASVAALEQIAGGTQEPAAQPVAPGLNEVRTLQQNRGPSRQTLELALAATGDSSTAASQAIRDLIEAGGKSISTEPVVTATAQGGIPVPVRNPRRTQPTNVASITTGDAKAKEKPAPVTQKIGRYALSGGNMIGSLGEIHAPGYSLGATSGETLASTFGARLTPVIVGRFDPKADNLQPALVVRTN